MSEINSPEVPLREASGEFTIALSPAAPELDGTGRFDFTKTWTGGIAGTGRGLMLSAGDPSTGTAGYVAIEVVEGTVDGRHGSFALQQFGTMADGDSELRYQVVPGSATGELAGLTGTIELTVTDGRHHVVLRYAG